jgi:hypothetical protein
MKSRPENQRQAIADFERSVTKKGVGWRSTAEPNNQLMKGYVIGSY